MSALFFMFVESMFFWPVFIIGLIVLFALSEKEEAIWSIIFTATLLFLASFKMEFIGQTFDSWSRASITIGSYLLIGVVWSGLKWVLRARRIRTRFIEIRDQYLDTHCLSKEFFKKPLNEAIDACTDEDSKDKIFNHHSKFARKVEIEMSNDIFGAGPMTTAQHAVSKVIPRINNHKKSIMMWIAYWPVSLTWFALHDAMKEISETIYNMVSRAFQKMSDRIFKDVL